MLKKISIIVFVLLFSFPTVIYGGNNSAQSAVVVDANSGDILYEKNKDEKLPMASTTKIMTALIAIESGKLNDTVTITFDMVNTIGNSVGLKENDTVSLNDLVVAMMLASGNDSANAVAIYLGGSLKKFAVMMNNRAQEIGMKNSLFVTPSGLDEGNHHSSAYDMALLTSVAVQNEKFVEICSLKSSNVVFSGKVHTFYNHNKLLSMLNDCIGVKTGYTEKSGRCLVSAVNRNSKILVCVTINDVNDWDDHINLFKSCIKKYKKVSVEKNININVVGGVKESVLSTYASTNYVLDETKITVEEYYFKINYAPIKFGDVLGYAKVYYGDKLLQKVPIKAKENVKYLR